MSIFQVLVRTLDFCPDPLESFRTEFLHARSKFFLESSVIKPDFSRFSFMGDAYGPLSEIITYDAASQKATIERNNFKETIQIASIFDLLKTNMQERKVECPVYLPFCFNLGYVGFLGYELKGETTGSKVHESETYDSAFIFSTRLIAFDHIEQKCYLLHLITDDETRKQAEDWFDAVEKRMKVQSVAPKSVSSGDQSLSREKMSLQDVEQWISKNATIRHEKNSYIEKIHEALQEIVNGESYEICLTNMIEFEFEHSSFDLYCVMRELTPAPHAGYFNISDFHLVSSSPERFLSVDLDRYVEVKPIKGTRPRGLTVKEDTSLIEDLRINEKDLAENLMIVDLMRSDLGQVCNIQSVHVPSLFDVETYSHVHQLVSTIRGHLKPDVSTVECIRAVFPGGSMTGAPKKRTMEIIDRLEQGPRGVYSGTLGWFGLCGACDLNIIIRSVSINKGYAKFGVGGAITSLSNPEEEFAETMVKALNVVEAVEYLRGGAQS
jgi:para-aminobenzoate synthetase